jgi:hypothetical protein
VAVRKLASYDPDRRVPATMCAMADSRLVGSGIPYDCQLASFVRIKNVSLVLYGLSQTRMSCVVVAAPFTEGIAATPSTTVGTDGSSAVSSLRHGTIAAGRPDVTIAVPVFDLAELVHGYAAFANCSSSANNSLVRSSHRYSPTSSGVGAVLPKNSVC